VLLVAAAVLGQLLLEAFTFPTGAASVLQPPDPAAGSPGWSRAGRKDPGWRSASEGARSGS